MKKRRSVAEKRAAPRQSANLLSIAVPALAVLLALVPLPPSVVEHVYTRGMYAAIQPAITFASNLSAFNWMDLLLALVVAVLAGLGIRDLSMLGAWRGFGSIARRLVVWSAVGYIGFLITWGFNYRRERVVDRLSYRAAAVTPSAALRLATTAIDRVNALHAAAHDEGWVTGTAIDPALAGAFDSVAREIGALPRGIVVGRPKRSALDWYFQRAGVAGMTDPIFLETLVASDVLPFERPHVVAHEWAHLAGLADEGEANFAGWLACARGSVADQYSGWLFMYGQAIAAIAPAERTALTARLGEGPRADLVAIRERSLRHVSPRLSSAGWRVYDSYLKANRVEAGTRSYTEVVRLALGLDAARDLR